MDGHADGTFYDPPSTGVLAGGLVLDGASFSKRSGSVSDCAPGHLRGACPVLWLKPSLTAEASKRATAALRSKKKSLLDRARRASIAMARRQSLDSKATSNIADVAKAAAAARAGTATGAKEAVVGPAEARAAVFGSVGGSTTGRQKGGMFSSLRSVTSTALESQASQQLVSDTERE